MVSKEFAYITSCSVNVCKILHKPPRHFNTEVFLSKQVIVNNIMVTGVRRQKNPNFSYVRMIEDLLLRTVVQCQFCPVKIC